MRGISLLFALESVMGPHLSGIGRYTRGLIDTLENDPRIASVLGFDHTGVRDARQGGQEDPGPSPVARKRPRLHPRSLARTAFRLAPKTEGMRRWMHNRYFRNLLSPHRDRIYHEPNYILRPFDGPTVTTIHDLSVLRYPQFHPRDRVKQFERELPRTLARADRIITDAAMIRQEVIDSLGIAPGKIFSVPIGIDAVYRPVAPAERAAVLDRHGLADRGYLFCVGTLEPRKNLTGLVEAYERLPAALRRRFPLVMAGGRGWREELFEAKVASLERTGELRRLGYVPEEDLPALYSGARGFAFPSFYEGFGLPPLEAMACATPVLTSRGTTMEELMGDVSLLVDPEDVASISRGLEELLDDDGALPRAAAAAPVIAERYSWQVCAEGTIAVYESLIG